MNLKNATVEQLDDLFLPDEARVALEEGHEWEFQPDSIEGADATSYFCDDCDTWHQVWTAWGLRLDVNGTLFEVEWDVDSDGDWQVSDEYAYGTFDHAKSHAESKESWLNYARWVVRHKDDPLNNFGWSARPDRKERVWTVDFAPSVASPVVRRARAGKKKFIPVSEFPAHLRVFLCADERGMMKDFASWDDFKARAMNLVWVSDTRATLTIGETVYPTSARKVGFVKAAREFIYNNKQEVK
jgi:hypothetical protein